MARIISSRKKYVPVKDLKVYPSNKETIEVIPDDGFNGAHRYRAQMCAGFVNRNERLEGMKVEVNRNDEMPKAGDLVIDELGNIGILMHNGYIWLLKHSGKPVDVPTLVSYTDSDKLYKFEGTVTLSND